MGRARVGVAAIAVTSVMLAACSGCGKAPGGQPSLAGNASASVTNRTTATADSGPAAVRDVAMWTSAREGTVLDLASLATHEGAAGLVEAAADPDLRATSLRAMAYARGWAQLPYLVSAAAGTSDDDARVALESIHELAARPRRSEDVEDTEELRDGCDKLGVLARDAAKEQQRRIRAIRALRMMPCPAQEIPVDLDAR